MTDEPNPGRTWFSPVRAVVAVALLGLVATTALALPGEVVAGEEPVFAALNDLPRWAGLPLQAVMHLGTFVAALAVAAVAALARRPRLAVAAAAGWALVRVTTTIMKAAVGRPRPPDLLPDVALRQHLPFDDGFPSSHAANAAALAVAVTWAVPRLRWPLAVVAVAVGLGRLYVGVHLPLDLVGGWCTGVLCGLATVRVVERTIPAPTPLDHPA